ncbi:MAG: transcriptional repressor [Synergistaceae bacterium]|jgi:Fur family ferric uptake transcriptional regulator|nr:transcriptional repressor [Synergistaceae bacterium]
MEEARGGWPEGIKRTKQRRSVLDILERSENPLGAADICSMIERGGGTAWLSTVYRILELFVKKGVAVKTSVMNSEMALYELNRFKHKHYAVCMSCRRIIPMDNCPMESFIPVLEDANFRMLGHNLEIFGYCGDCDPLSGRAIFRGDAK